jgi:hypothetical protein
MSDLDQEPEERNGVKASHKEHKRDLLFVFYVIFVADLQDSSFEILHSLVALSPLQFPAIPLDPARSRSIPLDPARSRSIPLDAARS